MFITADEVDIVIVLKERVIVTLYWLSLPHCMNMLFHYALFELTSIQLSTTQWQCNLISHLVHRQFIINCIFLFQLFLSTLNFLNKVGLHLPLAEHHTLLLFER